MFYRKAEMEARRKAEEAIRLKQEEEDRKAALALQAQLEKEAQEDSKYREQLEQERRDHELALRLAQESNGQVEDSPPLIRKYEQSFNFISIFFITWYIKRFMNIIMIFDYFLYFVQMFILQQNNQKFNIINVNTFRRTIFKYVIGHTYILFFHTFFA